MIAGSITPSLVPATEAGRPQRITLPRAPLPLASLNAIRRPAVVYGLAAMDDRGRLSDRAVLHELGWTPGTPLAVRVEQTVAVVTTDGNGPGHVTAPGQFRLPAVIRHRLGLRSGDRVLLVAKPDDAELTVYPPATLDALIAGRRPDLRGAPV